MSPGPTCLWTAGKHRLSSGRRSHRPDDGRQTMSTVTTPAGVHIFYKDWGSKSAQPILFHQRWPLSSDDWDAQRLFFVNNGYRVVAHDRCRHGRSTQCLERSATRSRGKRDDFARHIDRDLAAE